MADARVVHTNNGAFGLRGTDHGDGAMSGEIGLTGQPVGQLSSQAIVAYYRHERVSKSLENIRKQPTHILNGLYVQIHSMR
jgi:hypothetical protein